MSTESDTLDTALPADGQAVRLPGSAHSATLHDQLYRYAEDLQQMVERNGELEAHYEALRESSDRLLESREELEKLMRSSRDIHLITDASGTILQSNPAGAALAPLSQLLGRQLNELVFPSHHDTFLALQSNAIESKESPEQGHEIHLRRETGSGSPLIVTAQALAVSKDGYVPYLHWILRDVTALRENEFENQISSMVFKSADEGVMITDIEGIILAVNPAFSRITGYSAEEAIGHSPRLLSSGMQDAAFYADFWRALRENGRWQGEISNRKKNGEVYPEWLTVSAARDVDGSILSYIAVFSDLSRLLRAEKRLSYLAHHDTLTGLPNRLLFQDRLAQMLAQAKRSGVQFTLIFIDLDHFKPINDTLGHAVGDHVLQEAAKRLARTVRECDTVARLGGDEFVILAPGLVGEMNIGSLCSKLIDALGQPMLIEENEIFLGGSFGCAEYPFDGEDEVALLKNADAAMYRAKAAGGNGYAIHHTKNISLLKLKEHG
jgi:diguanylate cyclase (GGDEF)-like protein/PAS domain S-box-containing protein